METMTALRERAEENVPVGDLLEALLHETGYIDALKAERTIEAQGREENLEELVEVAREFDATAEPEQDTLDVFLQSTALVADADTRSDDDGLVTLMTLHNAKGLEYPIVFLAGMEEGVFPHSRALDEGGLEEERRLAYVGITRAMRQLYLTSARRRAVFGATQYGMRSRFLDEIPYELTDRPSGPSLRAGFGAAVQRPGQWASAASSAREAAPPSVDFRLGDDVMHAAFGAVSSPGSKPAGSSSYALPATAVSASSWPSTRRSRSSERVGPHGSADHRWQGDRRRSPPAVAHDVEEFAEQFGERPGLATILVGDDPGSAVYVAGKQKASAEVGMEPSNYPLPADTSREDLVALIERLNDDSSVDGILLQLPLPGHLDGVELTGMIDADKDVDGLTPVSAGRLTLGIEGLRPCTPQGVMALLGRPARSSRAPRSSSSAGRTSSASRWCSFCSKPTRPSRPATRARRTCRPSAAAPTC